MGTVVYMIVSLYLHSTWVNAPLRASCKYSKVPAAHTCLAVRPARCRRELQSPSIHPFRPPLSSPSSSLHPLKACKGPPHLPLFASGPAISDADADDSILFCFYHIPFPVLSCPVLSCLYRSRLELLRFIPAGL